MYYMYERIGQTDRLQLGWKSSHWVLTTPSRKCMGKPSEAAFSPWMSFPCLKFQLHFWIFDTFIS